MTLGVGEPFITTATVALYFALLFSMPLILWQLYGFLLPAFKPAGRRVTMPLMAMIPVLFIVEVFPVLRRPAGGRNFLQNFNSDECNILVQAKDYYKFAGLIMVAMGLVFQMPLGILALTRLGVVTVPMLQRNPSLRDPRARSDRRRAARRRPGHDAIEFVLLVLLYEGSISSRACSAGRSWSIPLGLGPRRRRRTRTTKRTTTTLYPERLMLFDLQNLAVVARSRSSSPASRS